MTNVRTYVFLFVAYIALLGQAQALSLTSVFDKWSWSTAATDSPDSTLEDFQADDEDQTPQAPWTNAKRIQKSYCK